MAKQVEFLGLTESGRSCQSCNAPQACWRLVEHNIVHGVDADHGPFTRQDVVRERYYCDRCARAARLVLRDQGAEQAFAYAG
jgi:hypothetical protein